MGDVMCRAELHGAPTREQYGAFHAGMGKLGLEQTITRNGRVFRLPTGEYLGITPSDSMALLAVKISTLAFQITGSPCKLTLTPVDAAKVYTLCLEEIEEIPGFAAELGLSSFDSFTGSRR